MLAVCGDWRVEQRNRLDDNRANERGRTDLSSAESSGTVSSFSAGEKLNGRYAERNQWSERDC